MSESIRILLVDDEESFWRPMGEQLRAKGFLVDVACSGREALDYVLKAPDKYQVAVIDQVMGPPNGTEIMLEVRRVAPLIETIILTGWGDMGPGERAMELGAYRYMSKPSSANELAVNVRTAARFGRERQRSMTLQALVQAGELIGGVQTEDELYRQLYKRAGEILPHLQAFLVALFDEQNWIISVPFCTIHDAELALPHREPGQGLTEHVLQTKAPLLLPTGDDAFLQEHGLAPLEPRLSPCTSTIVVPLLHQERVLGTVQGLTFRPGVHYTPEHVSLLQAFANQVAVALQNVRQLREAHELKDATAALARHRGRDVLRIIVEEAHHIIDSDYTGLILQDKDGFLHKVHPVIPERFFDDFDEPRQEGGVTRTVAATRQPRVIPDTHQDPLVKDRVRDFGIRSMLAMPLVYGDTTLGVLYGHMFERRYFNDHDVNLWSAFASQAAVVLHNTQEEEREVQDYKRLAEALGTLTGQLSLREAVVRVATAAKKVFQSDTCRIAYVDPPTQRIVCWEWAEGDPEIYRFEGGPRRDGTTYHVIRTKKPLFRSDANLHEKPSPCPELVALGLKSFAPLPLIHKGRVSAVLHCNFLTHQQPFSDYHMVLFEAFSGRAAEALDGARRHQISALWQEPDKQIVMCGHLHGIGRLFAEYVLEAYHADLAVFYPYDPTTAPETLLAEDTVVAGKLLTPWETPQGGLGGKVMQAVADAPDGLLIVNHIQRQRNYMHSRISERERIQAFVALRLEVIPEGQSCPRVAGVLFLNYRQRTWFEPDDLMGLLLAGSRVAAAMLRLRLEEALRNQSELRNRQLRSIVNVLRAYRARLDGHTLLDRIAESANETLGVDACTLVAYDPEKEGFTYRGGAGLFEPAAHYTLSPEFKECFMGASGPIVIHDVQQDTRTRNSGFVQREGIQSVVVFPLCVEEEALGLIFVNYRQAKEPTKEEMEALSLFADMAALVLCESRIREKLGQTQSRLERRLFLNWVSMMEATWRHSLGVKASSIRNYAAVLQQLLHKGPPELHADALETVDEIDRLATEIAAAPPRVPQSWEMEEELCPLGPLIEELAEREGRSLLMKTDPPVEVTADVGALGGVQVRGYRRWLIYALESLLQNARNAMTTGGKIAIHGQRAGDWAEVRIRDTGPGIPKKVQRILFQNAVPREHNRVGMGIGGLLAAIIFEDHGGNIQIEHSGSSGTTVLIRLPIAAEVKRC